MDMAASRIRLADLVRYDRDFWQVQYRSRGNALSASCQAATRQEADNRGKEADDWMARAEVDDQVPFQYEFTDAGTRARRLQGLQRRRGH